MHFSLPWRCILYYHPQTKFAKVMFSQVSVCPQGSSLSRGDLCPRGLCPGVVCVRGSLSGGGVSVQGRVSVQWGSLSGRLPVRLSVILLQCILVLLYVYTWQIDEVSAFDDTRSSIDPLDNAIVPLDEFSVRTLLRTPNLGTWELHHPAKSSGFPKLE